VEKVATRKAEANRNTSPKASPARRNNGPSALAKKTESKVKTTVTASSAPQSHSEAPSSDTRSGPLVLGNPATSAEALINERRMAQ
jgi:hypothetical protein